MGGFTRWDAAGEWLAVAYGGGRYFARASDVSLNDAPGRDGIEAVLACTRELLDEVLGACG